ncbi:hypothetical protein GQ600_19688 [Phytophthora cactorum]|nr:hypothetical protein GQ600_19688 [Phytophthora cactorum]
MTSDSELGANIIDDKTVESPDGITVYEELDSMTLIEAANQFDVVAADNSSIMKRTK